MDHHRNMSHLTVENKALVVFNRFRKESLKSRGCVLTGYRFIFGGKEIFMLEQKKIAIIGLGYVGLPLAVEFGKARHTLGFDIDVSRVEELKEGKDSTFSA